MLFALLFPNHKKYLMSFLLNSFLKFLGLVKKKSNLLIVGLDYSGKTTIVNQIKPDPLPSDKASTIPTVGFSVEQFVKSKITFTVFDMSGAGRYRNLWEHYYGDADAIIFVLDASDKARLLMARDEFESMMEHKLVKGSTVPILIFANKMDISGALTAAECSEALDLQLIKDRPWQICACTAITGEGLDKGLEWLTSQL